MIVNMHKYDYSFLKYYEITNKLIGLSNVIFENNNKSKWISEEKERAIAKHKNIIEISYGDLLIIKIEELESMIQINKR